jgi:hypothetical protein
VPVVELTLGGGVAREDSFDQLPFVQADSARRGQRLTGTTVEPGAGGKVGSRRSDQQYGAYCNTEGPERLPRRLASSVYSVSTCAQIAIYR